MDILNLCRVMSCRFERTGMGCEILGWTGRDWEMLGGSGKLDALGMTRRPRGGWEILGDDGMDLGPDALGGSRGDADGRDYWGRKTVNHGAFIPKGITSVNHGAPCSAVHGLLPPALGMGLGYGARVLTHTRRAREIAFQRNIGIDYGKD